MAEQSGDELVTNHDMSDITQDIKTVEDQLSKKVKLLEDSWIVCIFNTPLSCESSLDLKRGQCTSSFSLVLKLNLFRKMWVEGIKILTIWGRF